MLDKAFLGFDEFPRKDFRSIGWISGKSGTDNFSIKMGFTCNFSCKRFIAPSPSSSSESQ
ncbi:hypothetical protein A2U01_0072813, partial [Trifolium medium]|nr:hypothetical protein [Trifolium medium]